MATKHYNYFVTGGGCPIGRYFIRQLQEFFPGSEIIYSGRSRSSLVENVDFLNIDFNESDAEIVRKVNFSCDKIIHLASCTTGNCRERTPEEFFRANVAGPTTLFRVLLERGATSLFYLSSTALYNKFRGTYLFEYSEKTTADFYGLSKLLFEQSATDLSVAFGISVFGVRVPVLLVAGVKHNFLAKWRESQERQSPIVASHPDAPFNSVCPDWALWALYRNFDEEGSKFSDSFSVTNIFATVPTTLREVLSNISAVEVTWMPSRQLPQMIGSIRPARIPSYNASREIYRFLTCNVS
jgi:nucleoside-diphosphate-sugar epimerase